MLECEKNIPIESNCCYYSILTIVIMTIPQNDYKIEEAIKIYFKDDIKKVELDHTTIENLLIFKEEVHPSQIKGKGRSKEDFSIFSIISKFSNMSNGKKNLEYILKTPIQSLKILKYRHKMIEFIQNISIEDLNLILKC